MKKTKLLLLLALFSLSFITQSQIQTFGYNAFTKCGDNIYATGNNKYGQLANGEYDVAWSIVHTNLLSKIKGCKKICSSSSHTVVLMHDSTVWSIGKNDFYQLGDSMTNTDNVLRQVMSKYKIIDIEVAENSTLFLASSGVAYIAGELKKTSGLDGSLSAYEPQSTKSNVIAIYPSASNKHFICKTFEGKLWSWGINSNAQLGNDAITTACTNSWLYMGNSVVGSTSASSGFLYSVFVKSGEVWAVGDNDYGQLGVGQLTVGQNVGTLMKIPNFTNVIKVSAGNYHTVFLKSDGTVWSTGNASYGQTGLNNQISISSPQQINISNVVDVIAYTNNTVFIKEDGSVYVCGYNADGRINSTNKHILEPILFELCNDFITLTNDIETKSINVYPNPSSTSINISINKQSTVTIVSINGQVIQSFNANSNHNLDVSNYVSGTYFVKINSANETLVTKFVKI